MNFMILSDVAIRQGVETGLIGITPFNAEQLNPSSYSLTLGSRLLIPVHSGLVDAREPQVTYTEKVMDDGGAIIEPGAFVVASIAECISLPNTLAARLDARSTLARIGLNALQGSTHIEPGQRGSNEMLEITNVGPHRILVRPGMRIAKIVFEMLDQPSSRGYAGPYLGQSGGGVR